jgi:hypothetical protein
LRAHHTATTDPVQRKERAAEVAKNDALLAERRQQKLELLEPADTAQRGVGLKEAMDLDQVMTKAIAELSRDSGTLFQG